MLRFTALATVALACLAASTQAAISVRLDDNFDSYADQAAFQANWTITGTAPVGLGTEQALSPTQSVKALTTATRSGRTIAETQADAYNTVEFSFSFYDANGTAAAYRQYGELIDGAASNSGQLVAMGLNNNIASSHYMARILGLDGGSGASQFFKLDGVGAPTRSTGWHDLKAVISLSNIEFYVDDVLSKTVALTGTSIGRSYDTVRLGSNLTSTQVAYFDNAYVALVPEPTTAAALGLIGMAGLVRRRK